MNKMYLLLIVMLAVLILTSGCGGKQPGNEQPGSTPDKNVVIIEKSKFQPATLTIHKGETVTWVNEDQAPHTATGKGFNSGNLAKGGVFKHTFTESGTFDYICTYHPSMKGQVVVK
ncbi:MAG: cupredoxin family copper-binding protein [Firmicutes bacterium]|nr:cupredoxin family copper-binding protein [Bacillota bacterium]